MKSIVSCELMRKREAEYFACGVPSREVMYRAGRKMAEYIMSLNKSGNILVVCGSGNNGGDGFVAASVLDSHGYNVTVCYVGDGFTADSAYFYDKCTHLLGELTDADIILDAIYGTGFHGELTGKALEAVRFINNSGAFVVSADIPSGVAGDAPHRPKEAVNADVTLCVQAVKTNCACGDAAKHAGKLVVLDVGIPNCQSEAWLINAEDISLFTKKRDVFGHKNSFGSVGIVGGVPGMEGAAMLSASAAAKSGAGKVSIVSSLTYYGQRPPHIMQKETLDGFDAIAYGMGAGLTAQDVDKSDEILKQSAHVVLDADALTVELKNRADIIAQRRQKGLVTLLTPHVGEAARLLECDAAKINLDPVQAARDISRLYGCSVVLKSWYTVICHNGIYVLNHPQSVLAKAGSGDCLAGICASVLSNGGHPALAVLIHSRAGSLASERYGEMGATASDIISCIGS